MLLIFQWGIFITAKLFKFSVLSMANLGTYAYRKFNVAKSFGDLTCCHRR